MELVKADDQKKEENFYKPEDTYDPESVEDDDLDKCRNQQEEGRDERLFKRKRKSRWGDKDTSVPPPMLIVNTPPSSIPTASTGKIVNVSLINEDITQNSFDIFIKRIWLYNSCVQLNKS